MSKPRPQTRKYPPPKPDAESRHKGELIGDARISTVDQNLALQRDVLSYTRGGDTLVVWKLDRPARSMKQLIKRFETLRLCGIGLRSLAEQLDATTARGLLVFYMFRAPAEFQRSLIRERTRAGFAALGFSGG